MSDLIIRFLGFLTASLLRTLSATWRVKQKQLERLDQGLIEGERFLVIFWHGKYLPLFPLLRGREGCIFTTFSFRGLVIRDLCRRLGYTCLTLPQNHGMQRMSDMQQALQPWNLAALAVDGPLGPYHKAKSGAVRLASTMGYTVLPVTTASRWKLEMQRWDRMELPLPFSKVVLMVGTPIRVPESLDPVDIGRWKETFNSALEALDQKAEREL